MLLRRGANAVFSGSWSLRWNHGLGLVNGVLERRRAIAHVTILHALLLLQLLILQLIEVEGRGRRSLHEVAIGIEIPIVIGREILGIVDIVDPNRYTHREWYR